MKHLLIILISILLLSSFLVSCEKKEQVNLTFPNGDKYVGEFKDDKPNGQGTYTWSDGRKYEGEFKDGYRNGQGTYTLPNGSKYVGEWRENKSWNGTEYDKNGNIIVKFVNGKGIEQ